VYGDDGDNKSLMLFLREYIPFLLFKTFEGNEMLYFFSLFFLSGGYLVPLILLSDTCPFLPLVSLFLSSRFRALAPFYFLVFLEQSPSFENIASGSRNDLSINFTGNNRNGIMFLAILSRVRSRIILGESGDGNEWIYVDAYFRSRSSMYE
jgi:hypothetical protein